jgi:hypothetical protein
MKIGHIDLNQLQGFSDKLVGLGKEVVGTVVGRDGIADEGRAQQETGTARLKALRAEAEADTARVKAKAEEKRQQAAQQRKERANA